MSPVQKRQHGECRKAKSSSEVGCVWWRSWVSLRLITVAPRLSRLSRVMTQNIRGQTKRKCWFFSFSELESEKSIIFFENCRPIEVAPGTIRTIAKFTFYFGASCNFFIRFPPNTKNPSCNLILLTAIFTRTLQIIFSVCILFFFCFFYRPRILILWVQFPLLWESRVAWLMV